MTKRITEDARGIRRVKNGDQSSIELAVHGDMERESAENIVDAKYSAITPIELLKEGKQAKERGNEFFRAGDLQQWTRRIIGRSQHSSEPY